MEKDIPKPPKVLMSVDPENGEIYLIHTDPYALLWVKQVEPCGIIVLDGHGDESVLQAISDHFKFKGGIEFSEN